MAAITLLDPNTFKGANLVKQAQALKAANKGRKSMKGAKNASDAVLAELLGSVKKAEAGRYAAILAVFAFRDNLGKTVNTDEQYEVAQIVY